MREFLFRGQTRKLGEKVKMNGEKLPGRWVYGGLYAGPGAYSIIYGGGEIGKLEDKYTVHSDTVGQYTGLPDSNGTKVFEGDICDFTVFDEFDNDIHYRGVVVYTGSRFELWQTPEKRFSNAANEFSFDLDWVISQDAEFRVVGNVSDNPDLMATTPAPDVISNEEAARLTGYRCPICAHHDLCTTPGMKPLCGEEYTHFKDVRKGAQ